MDQDGNKTPLVLLCGLLCDKFIWQEVAQHLADVADVHIFNFAGLNHFSDMADKVLQTTPESFALAGHSMGGRVALELVRKAPARVTRLALLNTGVHPVKDAEIPGRQRLLDLAKNQGMEAVAATWLPPMLSENARQNARLLGELKTMVLRHSTDDFYGEIHALLNRPNAEEVLPLLSVPTLLISGTEDNWSPVSQHRDMQAYIKNSRLIALEGSGHMSTVEMPEAVSLALRNWLAN